MPLSTIAALLEETSGRTDLFDETGALTTTGLFYINSAQRMLDRLSFVGKSRAKLPSSIVAGDYKLKFSYARAVEEVWVTDEDGEQQLDLDYYSLENLRKAYSEPADELTQGTPLYGAVNIIRLAPGGSVPAGSYKTGDIVSDDAAVDGILFYPPADGNYTMILQGLFYSPSLSVDADKSFWTERHPDLLLQAINYKLEVFLRNREGMRDWLEALQMEAAQVSSDYAFEGAAGNMQMEG